MTELPANGRFQPSRLRLARELKRMTQTELKGQCGISAASVSQLESGASSPSAETISALSKALETPPEFFFRPVAETHEGFFRSLRRTSVTDRRHARAVAQIAHDLAAEGSSSVLMDLALPAIPVESLTDTDTPIAAAKMVRQAWKVSSGPIANVVELLEEHGIVVLRLSLSTANVDAFSLPFADRPVVVLGSDKNDRARSRFDAAHELGHLVMHGQEIWGTKEVETQAHLFAAEFLMPEAEIRAQLPTWSDWETLFSLKKTWQVSLAALLMRAKTLGQMDGSAYLNSVKAASARGWRRVEPLPLGAPEEPSRSTSLLRDYFAGDSGDWLPAKWFDLVQLSEVD
ncbi:Zn-dependent peptidase ImmA, M78 family [Williamsia maris]|uniref:Zn-dependent peptidase ImmA, M78 family n=1 Tax=Williamsia maris TaxID=72806 RepID=A0ABT1HCR1_9NOCA|nr:Zn-dependent peptidase ImmA, M78 family [Williamsia maris]